VALKRCLHLRVENDHGRLSRASHVSHGILGEAVRWPMMTACDRMTTVGERDLEIDELLAMLAAGRRVRATNPEDVVSTG
jgi:hypothetical protein